MRTLLLVGVGRMGRPYLAAARRLGLRVHAVETAARAESIADQVDQLTLCRGDSDELWAEAAWAAVAQARPDGVVAFSEPQVLAAAMIADELGLPGPSLRAATISRNKALQLARLPRAIVQPAYLVTDRLAEASEWATAHLPVVVKPLSSAGSAGVELVPDAAGFAEAAERRKDEGRLLVEEAVDGPEFSWEALVVEGQVWFANLTAKETTGPPNFVEISHCSAAKLDDPDRARIDEFGTSVLRAIGMCTGLVHLEFRMSPTGPAVNGDSRAHSGRSPDGSALTYGLDWFELVVRAALGKTLPAAPAGPIRYAASYMPAPPERCSRSRG